MIFYAPLGAFLSLFCHIAHKKIGSKKDNPGKTDPIFSDFVLFDPKIHFFHARAPALRGFGNHPKKEDHISLGSMPYCFTNARRNVLTFVNPTMPAIFSREASPVRISSLALSTRTMLI